MKNSTVISAGHGLVESARWHDGRVWFADWFAGTIFDAGHPVARLTSFPICFDWLPDGTLVTTGSGSDLVRVGADGTMSALARIGQYPNDIAVHPNGTVYIDDIGFEYGTEFRPGSILAVSPSGDVSTVADDLAFPNGMRVTADGSTLIVAESYANRLTAFTIRGDGTLADRRVWADLGEGNAPDGICIAADGSVWYATVPGQRCARVAEGGAELAEVTLDRGCFDCVLDDAETALYVTAADFSGGDPSGTGQLMRIDL